MTILSIQSGALVAQAASSGWQRFLDAVGGVWNYTLFRIGEQEVHLSQVVIAALILLVGAWAARKATELLRRRLERDRRVDATGAAAVEKILFYLLLVALFVWVFQVLNIPLTLFAFLGGAVAIGLGFGAQNIIANLISGVILMLERPIRIGDLVEVADHRGRIEEIRFRCTRIKTVDGIDVLVPNTVLLERNVINWTLSDKLLRTSVTVGVQYGSDTDLVAKLIERVVAGHGRILQRPEPTVVFDDFGESALIFKVYFWVEVHNLMEMQTIASDVRFRIDKLFREAGVVIAFPQRDVHLNTTGPIDVRLAPPEEATSGEEPPDRTHIPGPN
jgi:small-conductance mechanosensitive channel